MSRQTSRSVMWERVGAATGIAFVVFLLASFLVIPDAPKALDDPVGDIRAFYVDNSSNWQASMYLTGIAAFFFLCFLGSLTTALARVDAVRWMRVIVFPAGAVTLALVLVGAGINDALATRVAAEADQAVIRALYDVQAFTVAFAAFSLAALVGATSLSSRGARLFPPLVGWLGVLLVPLLLMNGFAVFAETGFFSPTGAFAFIVLLLFFAWILALSAALIRRAAATALPDAP